MRRKLAIASSLIIACPLSTPVYAKASDNKVSEDKQTIQVTAKSRFEVNQKTPISTSVFTKEQVKKLNVHDLQGMLAFIPSASFSAAPSSKDRSIFIRGIGTVAHSRGLEPSVSTVIDGVVLSRGAQATSDILDVDHIDVLKGPQGTRFGKNASAGLINIVTAAPTQDFHGFGEASYFSGNEYRISGGISGGIIKDKLAANASFLVSGFDGNVHNDFLGNTVNGYKHRGGRTKFLWTPSDRTKVTLGLDYIYSNDNVPNGIFVSSAKTAYPSGKVTNNAALQAALKNEAITPTKNNNHISNDTYGYTIDHNGGASITLDQDLGDGYSLTSITAYRRWQNKQIYDYDQLAHIYDSLPKLVDVGWINFWQASQEIRIASPKGHFFDYVAGFYYLHSDEHEIYDRYMDKLSGSGVASYHGHANFGTRSNNYAIFGEGNLNFTKKFRAVLGLRLLRDDLSYFFGRQSDSDTTVTGIRPSFKSSGSTSHYGYVDRIGLQYDVTNDIHSYFTYSHGYKGPAYNIFFSIQSTDTSVLKPETNNSYEIGLKTQFWDKKITANFAAFIENFSNYQANNVDSTAGGALITHLVNAGTVSTKGVEGDIRIRPIKDFSFGGNFAYNHAVVDHFNCPVNASVSCNVDGKPLPFAPRWKLVANADYATDLSDRFRFTIGGSYNWQSKTQYSLTETADTVQKAYGILNFNTSITDKKNKLSVMLIMRNALNTHYSPYLTYGSLGGVTSWISRDYGRYGGVTIHKDF